MKKYALAAALAAMFCLSALAETTQKKDTFSNFTGISVSNNFVVTLTSGTSYSASLDIDSRVADYCRMYLQGTTLVIDVNEKDFPKELKAQIRRSGASSIVAVATITVPDGSLLQNITLTGNAALSCSRTLEASEDMFVSMEGNSKITSLVINSSKAVTIKAEKNAEITADLTVSNVKINAAGNSEFDLKVKAADMNIVCGNSSNIKLNGSLSSITAETSGGSEISFSGEAALLKVTGKGNSFVDALSANVTDAELVLSGADCDVNASKTLKVNQESGSKIIFAGEPAIAVERIVNSSLTRSTDPANRKR